MRGHNKPAVPIADDDEGLLRTRAVGMPQPPAAKCDNLPQDSATELMSDG
jgi:hypothetical protein